jgi:hypothetical protein
MSARTDDECEDTQAVQTSRVLGVVDFVAGLGMLALAISGVLPSVKVTAGLTGIGTFLTMMGAGLVVMPWRRDVLEANNNYDEDSWFSLLSVQWKLWFFFSLLVSFGLCVFVLIESSR